MQMAIHLKTTVLSGGKIELAIPNLPVNEDVEVIVLIPQTQSNRSILDVLAESPGQRIFKTAEDVDSYLESECETWHP